MTLLDRYRKTPPLRPPAPQGLAPGRDLTLDDWKAILARAERGEVIRLHCDAVGGEFVVAPAPVAGSVTFTPAEILRMCKLGLTAADAAAIYNVKKTFGGGEVTDERQAAERA